MAILTSIAVSSGLATYCTVLGCGLVAFLLWRVVYGLWLHPLARYPGPPLAAVTRLLFLYHYVAGDAVAWIDKCHQKYGDVVRVEPGRLSYITAEAWKDIYGHTTATHRANSKEAKNSKQLFSNGSYSISSAYGPEHARLRKIFSNAFSDRAIRQQEPILLQYARQMVHLVHRELDGPRSQNDGVVFSAVQLFNFATFDIMADLAFGESLDSLDKGRNPLVDAVMVNFKLMVIKSALRRHPWLLFIWQLFQKKEDKKTAALHIQSSHDRVSRRLEKGPDARDDIWGLVVRANGLNALTMTEMNNNANNLYVATTYSLPQSSRSSDFAGFSTQLTLTPVLFSMIAGTETTATTLSALTYLLLKNPDKLNRVILEIRSAKDASELKGDTVMKMKYLDACLQEALRSMHKQSLVSRCVKFADNLKITHVVHPPVPTGGLRVIGPEGNTILGKFLPKDVTCLPRIALPL